MHDLHSDIWSKEPKYHRPTDKADSKQRRKEYKLPKHCLAQTDELLKYPKYVLARPNAGSSAKTVSLHDLLSIATYHICG